MSVAVINPSSNSGPTDGSNSPFTITSGTSTNRPPMISGLTAPTTLNVNQMGTWTVNSNDQENGPITYSVAWGDEVTCSSGYCVSTGSVSSVSQTSTFTHSYSRAGTYRVIVTVQDASGAGAQTTATVQVSNIVQPPTVQSSVTATMVDASVDKAGTGFGPGLGIPNAYQNKNPNDWYWQATVTADAAVKSNISSITINHNASGEAWSTSNGGYYALVVLKDGVQVNTTYGTLIDLSSSGTTVLDLYGQPETSTFSGGTITVKFADGTSVSSVIPSSGIKQTPVSSANDQTGGVWDAVREYLKRQGQ